jgi:hypothetical protein
MLVLSAKFMPKTTQIGLAAISINGGGLVQAYWLSFSFMTRIVPLELVDSAPVYF